MRVLFILENQFDEIGFNVVNAKQCVMVINNLKMKQRNFESLNKYEWHES